MEALHRALGALPGSVYEEPRKTSGDLEEEGTPQTLLVREGRASPKVLQKTWWKSCSQGKEKEASGKKICVPEETLAIGRVSCRSVDSSLLGIPTTPAGCQQEDRG